MEDSRLRWFAVHTNARAEQAATRALEREGYRVFYPYELGTVPHRKGRKIGVKKAALPRYVFVALEPRQSLYAVSKTFGVSSVVCFGDEPLEIPAKAMADLFAKCEPDGKWIPKKKAPPPRFKEGGEARVLALESPWHRFIATIAEVDGENIRAWVSLFGRPTLGTFKAHQLQPVDEP